jgi:hypothetical protein
MVWQVEITLVHQFDKKEKRKKKEVDMYVENHLSYLEILMI